MDLSADTKTITLKLGTIRAFAGVRGQCESCGGGSTKLGFLARCIEASPEVREIPGDKDHTQVIDWFETSEARSLLGWVQGCEDTRWPDWAGPRLAEGSEHFAPLGERTAEVVKVTLPGTYGDWCGIMGGEVYQLMIRTLRRTNPENLLCP